ncbi:MAG: hypothetical protein ABEI86_06610, partial [Halobacteriaceae archaeon]
PLMRLFLLANNSTSTSGSPGGIVGAILDGVIAVLGWFAQQIGNLLEPIVKPLLDFVIYTPLPQKGGQLAWITRPENMFWPQVYDVAWNIILPLTYLLLFIGFIFSKTLSAWGVRSTYRHEFLKNNLVAGGMLVPLSWPFAVSYFAIMDGVAHAIAPTNIGGLATTLVTEITALIAAASLAGVGVGGVITALINISTVLLVLMAHALRILAVPAFLMIIPLVVGLLVSGVPYLSELAEDILEKMVKVGFMPVGVAVFIRLADIISGGSGSMTIKGFAATTLFKFVFAWVPLLAAFLVPVYFWRTRLPRKSSVQKSVDELRDRAGSDDSDLDGYDASGEHYSNYRTERHQGTLEKTNQSNRRSLDTGGLSRRND